ncbi:hypothetical protein QTI51_28590 [Variovorax sp. J22G73]|uniref:hypothetical protein n=1 Tax=unclassified Variovorax TaxID=663243 RepID=UPI002577403E|nr:MULTISPECIES: hypothetical protein [unclassified Variovorax]MDM0008896.1 hypothetical protein [Variovorax sp. J22R203]MDM0101268.1 hypothetical protein [Variovorax sp. J22G73]
MKTARTHLATSRGALLAAALLSATVLAGCAAAKDPNCPTDARDLPLASLYGRWEARFDGLPAAAAVQLGKHPDYDGVRGTITRNPNNPAKAAVAQLAGDVDDEGALSIDESQDGRAISGVWSGKLQARSCGREFRGTWRNAADQSTHPFVLSKITPVNNTPTAATQAAPTGASSASSASPGADAPAPKEGKQ